MSDSKLQINMIDHQIEVLRAQREDALTIRDHEFLSGKIAELYKAKRDLKRKLRNGNS